MNNTNGFKHFMILSNEIPVFLKAISKVQFQVLNVFVCLVLYGHYELTSQLLCTNCTFHLCRIY